MPENLKRQTEVYRDLPRQTVAVRKRQSLRDRDKSRQTVTEIFIFLEKTEIRTKPIDYFLFSKKRKINHE